MLYTKYLKAIISYDGITRVETYPYPKEAIREAILNAIAHKNYASLIPIQIKVFDDELIISNDCVFPDDWTVENLLKKHRSRPYNPLIANAFYRSGLIESWGRGIQKITDSCKVSGNDEPEFDLKSDEISIVFKAIKQSDDSDAKLPKLQTLMSEVMSEVVSEDMSKLEIERLLKVLEYLREHEFITSKIAAEINNTAGKTASRLLNKAEVCGLLKSEGKTCDKKYFKK